MGRFVVISFLVCVVVACMAFSSGNTKTVTADEIINDYINAMGGLQKLTSIKNVYMEGIYASGNGRKITTRKWIVNKQAMRTESSLSGITSYSIARKDSGWSYSPGRGQHSPEPMTAYSIAANLPNLDIEGPLVNYKAKGYKVTYVGTEEIEGTEAYKLEAVINDSLTKTFYVDPDSHFVMRVRTKSSMGGRVNTSAADYSNYTKTSDGYVFPMAIGSAKYSVIKVNTTISDNLFKPTK